MYAAIIPAWMVGWLDKYAKAPMLGNERRPKQTPQATIAMSVSHTIFIIA